MTAQMNPEVVVYLWIAVTTALLYFFAIEVKKRHN